MNKTRLKSTVDYRTDVPTAFHFGGLVASFIYSSRSCSDMPWYSASVVPPTVSDAGLCVISVYGYRMVNIAIT